MTCSVFIILQVFYIVLVDLAIFIDHLTVLPAPIFACDWCLQNNLQKNLTTWCGFHVKLLNFTQTTSLPNPSYCRAIRQAYLQNGGNDPDVLAQMSQMQAEAQAIEDQMNQKPPEKSHRGRQLVARWLYKFWNSESISFILRIRFFYWPKNI